MTNAPINQTLLANDIDIFIHIESSNKEVIILGNKIHQAINGRVLFDNMTITGKPGLKTFIKMSIEIKLKKSLQYSNIKYSN